MKDEGTECQGCCKDCKDGNHCGNCCCCAKGNLLWYLLGTVTVVVVLGLLLSRSASFSKWFGGASQTATTSPITTTQGPITKLTCEKQYYNPVIGFAKYYFSVEGVDVTSASSVDCTFTLSSADKPATKAVVTSPLTASPNRGGSTFRCTTQAIEGEPTVPTLVQIALKDNLGAIATCSASYSLPKP